MHNETLRDVLDWTSRFHADLHDCIAYCKEQAASERTSLLLDYLANHEQQLAKLILMFKEQGDSHALNTWCREHFEKKPVIEDRISERQLADLDADELVDFVVFKHSQIIDLYKTLHAKAPIAAMKQLLAELVSLEESYIKKMMQGSNRLEDL